jgi:hypothetical protein
VHVWTAQDLYGDLQALLSPELLVNVLIVYSCDIWRPICASVSKVLNMCDYSRRYMQCVGVYGLPHEYMEVA